MVNVTKSVSHCYNEGLKNRCRIIFCILVVCLTKQIIIVTIKLLTLNTCEASIIACSYSVQDIFFHELMNSEKISVC